MKGTKLSLAILEHLMYEEFLGRKCISHVSSLCMSHHFVENGQNSWPNKENFVVDQVVSHHR